mgnify:FL=1
MKMTFELRKTRKVLCNDGECPRSNGCKRYISAGSVNDIHIWFPRPDNSGCRNFKEQT